MFKFGLKLWSVNTDNYPNEASKLYEQGYFDYIELYAVPGTQDTIDKWKTLNIPFVIHAPHFRHGVNLAQKESLEKNLKHYEETKIFADALNSEHIIFHPGIGGDIEETARQLNIINDDRILIENKPHKAIPSMSARFCTGSKVKEIQFVLDNTNVGFCLDIGHAIAAANSFKQAPYEYVKKFISLNPTMYHLSDTDMDSEYDYHYNFGKGSLEVAAVLANIPKGSLISIETIKNFKDSLEDFKDDIKFLRKSF